MVERRRAQRSLVRTRETAPAATGVQPGVETPPAIEARVSKREVRRKSSGPLALIIVNGLLLAMCGYAALSATLPTKTVPRNFFRTQRRTYQQGAKAALECFLYGFARSDRSGTNHYRRRTSQPTVVVARPDSTRQSFLCAVHWRGSVQSAGPRRQSCRKRNGPGAGSAKFGKVGASKSGRAHNASWSGDFSGRGVARFDVQFDSR